MKKQVRRRKYVLKGKARFTALVVSLLIALSTLLVTTSVYSYEKSGSIEITVRQGDTLWDIAREYHKDGDIRRYIYDIKKLNKMSDSQIYAGQTILIPQ